MGYISLYRKYRSQDFSSLVGQKHIVKTLKNALVLNRIAHAYIFSGPRGTGKTSLARIFARALSCQNPQQGDPCNQCSVCQSISQGRSMDVIEIDAASNRGIEEIRALREQVNYMPLEGKYKVYIIDEAHMLTVPAFNALLKTLEEPPAHVLFILATTEVHKIPITILSRCQRLDFHRLSVEDITEHLKNIAVWEKLTVAEDTLRHIAVVADGGMRDALSLLDQLIAFKGNQIDHQDLLDLIGATTKQAVFNLLERLLTNDYNNIFNELQQIIASGVDVVQLNKDLLALLRDLMMIKMQITVAVDATQDYKNKLQQLGEQISLEQIHWIIGKLIKVSQESKWSNNPRIIFELALVEILNCENISAAPKLAPESKKTTPQPEVAPAQIDLPKVPQATQAPPTVNLPNTLPPSETVEKIEAVETVESSNLLNRTSLAGLKQFWPDILRKILEMRSSIGIIMQEAELHNLVDDQIIFVFKDNYSFHRDKLMGVEQNIQTVTEAIKQLTGKKFGIKAVLQKEIGGSSQAAQQAEKKIAMLTNSFNGQIIE